MSHPFAEWIIEKLSRWFLKKDPSTHQAYLCSFKRICKKVRPGDVLLIEGRNHIGTIIRHITQSPWTHAALYIGRLNDIHDPALRLKIKNHSAYDPDTQLLIESEIGAGTIVSPITDYQGEHIRILRPKGLVPADAQRVIAFAIGRLGKKYNLRHLLDLARFLFPWGIFPRRWRSSLFEHNALQPTKDICSSMIAESFQSVDYPILPLIKKGPKKEVEFIRRNTRLYTPSDFDYSPYFSVIKYPFFPLGQRGAYHKLPWSQHGVSND